MHKFRNIFASLKSRETLRDIAIIVGVLVARFYQTLFLSKPISKFFMLAHLDTLFFPMSSGQMPDYDQSLVQHNIPGRLFVADYWRHGIPLWNELSGFGMPLLADPQAFVLSPLYALYYIFPSMDTWNTLVIIELLIASLSTYFLCKEFEFSSVTSVAAALLFTFCPWILWQIELLGPGICLTPFVFLFFARLGKKTSLNRAILAGISAAICILSAHPEMAFVIIIFSSLLACLISYSLDQSKNSIISIFGHIIIAGMVAFGLSAPMLIPFGEYLKNADTYKFTSVENTGEPLSKIFTNFLFSLSLNENLYLGPLSWFGVLAVLCFADKLKGYIWPLVVSLLVSIVCAARFWPFTFLFEVQPFSAILPLYCLPTYLLFLVLISGLGINYLLNVYVSASKVRLSVFCISLLMITIAPLFETSINFKSWLLNAYCTISMLSIWLVTRRKDWHWKKAAYIAFAGLGILSLIITSLNSLPIRPKFEYPPALTVKLDTQVCSRVISIGRHFFVPNTNLVYKLPMAQVLNPLLPKGFTEFLEASGASVNAYYQTYPLMISRLLNLAGVRSILSVQPILDERALDQKSNFASQKSYPSISAEYANLLSLTNIEIFRDIDTGNIFCRLLAVPKSKHIGSYRINFDVENANGKTFSFNEAQGTWDLHEDREMLFSVFVPKAIRYWQVSVSLVSETDGHHVYPYQVSYGSVRKDGSWLLGNSANPNLYRDIRNERFKAINTAHEILSYSNKMALNRYFLVKQIVWVSYKEKALDYIKTHTDELRDIVVLDETQKGKFQKLYSQLPTQSIDIHSPLFDTSGTVKIIKDPNTHHQFKIWPSLTLTVKTPSTSLLVASDLYFPGWNVYIDGIRSKIFRADYLFRAVLIPAGNHSICFQYEPLSFIIGSVLLIVTVLLITSFYLKAFANFIAVNKTAAMKTL